MLANPEPESKSVFKNPLLYSSAVVIVASVIVGFIFFSRWDENRRIDRTNRVNLTEKQRDIDRKVVEQLGGNELEIQSFYAAPQAIHRGESVQLCYGVANAKTVTLEPQSNPVWPSHAYCVTASPKKDTTYTLTVTDGAGNMKSQTVDVQVH